MLGEEGIVTPHGHYPARIHPIDDAASRVRNVEIAVLISGHVVRGRETGGDRRHGVAIDVNLEQPSPSGRRIKAAVAPVHHVETLLWHKHRAQENDRPAWPRLDGNLVDELARGTQDADVDRRRCPETSRGEGGGRRVNPAGLRIHGNAFGLEAVRFQAGPEVLNRPELGCGGGRQRHEQDGERKNNRNQADDVRSNTHFTNSFF